MLEGGPMAHMLLGRGLAISQTLKSKASMNQNEILFVRGCSVLSKYLMYLFENNYSALLECAVKCFCIVDLCHVHAVVQSWYWFLSLASKGSIRPGHKNLITEELIVPLLKKKFSERTTRFEPAAITTYLKRECLLVYVDANSDVIAIPKLCVCDTGGLSIADMSEFLDRLQLLDECSESDLKFVKSLRIGEFHYFVTQGNKQNPIFAYALAVAVVHLNNSPDTFSEGVNKYLTSLDLLNVVLPLRAVLNAEFVQIVRWMTSRLFHDPAKPEFDSYKLISKLKSLIDIHPSPVKCLDNYFVNTITDEDSLRVFWLVWSATPMALKRRRPTCDILGKRDLYAGASNRQSKKSIRS
jgi:hypothetical protein